VVDVAQLQAEIEGACMDAIDGSPPGPRLYATMRRVVEARLRRLGNQATWQIAVGPGATDEEVFVEVFLRTPRRVERIRVTTTAL
jgi:hypothetical protein